jgi:TonB family protein
VSDLDSPASAGPAPPLPGSEGSGLLDIRRIARAYTDDAGSRPQPRPGDEWASITPVGQVLPHLVPARPATSSTNPLMWGLAGIASVVAIAAVALVLVLVKSQSTPRAAAPGVLSSESPGSTAPAESPEPEATTAVATLDRPAENAGHEPVADTPARAEPESTPTRTEKVAAKADKADKADKAKKADKAARAAARAEKAEKAARAEKAAKAARSDRGEQRLDEVGCLLAAEPPAYCQRYTKASRPARQRADEARSDLPARPSQNAIRKGMDSVRRAVTSCGASHAGGGQVKLSIKVGSDGEIASVSVKESPNDALGRCVASAARKASFPESQKGITFSYPFIFR